MPTGRAVLLLRRLSTGDNRLKTLNWNQNTSKEALSGVSVCSQRELGAPRRLSTFNYSTSPLRRSFSHGKITMAATDSSVEKPKHTNALASEKSPYLLQHAHNPVQWYPWGQEAFDKAKKENKLIFLSVGYSTCHWCHVMEHESFENEQVAEIMNKHFVNIKVDREERPDIDSVYMLFVRATTGSGGWPMSVFLTPDLHPVTGGTYFPLEDNWGRPGFKTILLSLAKKWSEQHQNFIDSGVDIIEAMKKITIVDSDTTNTIPGEAAWEKCVQKFVNMYEADFGGFGVAPKFPQVSIINFLFHYYARDKKHPEGQKCLDMCLHTLTKIAKGGIHDHISSGFSRYSVDNDWHVPHFEKMLYDQAQLIIAYTDAYLATKDEFYGDVVRDIIKYANRDLRHESGGFYSAEDADSYPFFGAPHKKEGAFYVWEYDELESILGEKTRNNVSYFNVFCDYFSVEETGNISPCSDPHNELSNKNVLIIYGSKEETAEKFGLDLRDFDLILNECVDILHKERQNRPRPHLDTKMLCSWNGLMISGLAQAGQGLGDKSFVDDAIKTAEFIKKHLYDATNNTLIRSCYRAEDGSITQIENPIQGFLDDYAFLIRGLLDLYEASLDSRWLKWAGELQRQQNKQFWDETNGGYYTSHTDDKTVVLRMKEEEDGAEPSGNSISCHNLQRLAAYADKSASTEGGEAHREMARKLLLAFSKKLSESPNALPEMVSALMFYTDSPTQVLISGGCSDPRTLELVRAVRSRLLPGRVLCVTDPSDTPVLSRVRKASDAPTAYVCRRYACSLPVTDVKQLENILDELPTPVKQE